MKSLYMTGVYCDQMPPGERKSGMPLSVLIPAPVNATPLRALRTRLANLSRTSIDEIITSDGVRVTFHVMADPADPFTAKEKLL
jgi:hypothetical protein